MDIQDLLRLQGYTLFDKLMVRQIQFQNSPNVQANFQELPIWRFATKDQKSGFILTQSYLVYQTTHYKKHENFFKDFSLGLGLIHSKVKIDHLSRVGLRYLSAVIPMKNEKLYEYLVNGLHGIDLTIPLRYSMCESVFDTTIENTSKGTLINRVHFRTGPLGYPPDINPHNLTLSPKFDSKETTFHAVIDIDHFIEKQIEFDSKKTNSFLLDLHKEIKVAFNANITKHAKKVWFDE